MTSIKSRILPRDAADIFIFLFVCLPFQFFPLFGVPFLAGFWALDSILAGVLMIVIVYILILLFTVWSLHATPQGIEFRRIFGSPGYLAWEDISSIRLASRKEVIMQGWLWPLFPAREMTACLSARGHVRFESASGICFFPPADTKEFFTLVGELRASAVPDRKIGTETVGSTLPVN